jgi:hemerythrin-like domain-containing protein
MILISIADVKTQPGGNINKYLCYMSKEIKPIRRSKQLAPLSREHHDGLMYVWKIREGLRNGAAIGKLKQYTIWFWQQHIKPHFYQEEKILLPYMPANHELAIRLKKEHENIREFILNLDREADQATFVQLCDLLDDHIRFEERQVFSFLEQTLPADKLNDIYLQLEQHPVCAGIWEDEFWVKK